MSARSQRPLGPSELDRPRQGRIGRLRRRAEFLAVAAAKRKSVFPGLILQARTGDKDVGLRLGFTASRKVGNAVQRNRAKRRLRAIAQGMLRNFADRDLDLVLIARETTPGRPFDDLKTDLARALAKLGLGPVS